MFDNSSVEAPACNQVRVSLPFAFGIMGVKSVIPITPRIENTALVDEGEKQPPSPPSAHGVMHLKPCSPRAIDRRALPQSTGQVITGMQPFKLRTRRGYLNLPMGRRY